MYNEKNGNFRKDVDYIPFNDTKNINLNMEMQMQSGGKGNVGALYSIHIREYSIQNWE